MRNTKKKLVVIMLVSMAVAFAVIALAFNLIMRAYVQKRAESSISLYRDVATSVLSPGDAEEAAMMVASFSYDPQKDKVPDGEDEEDTSFWEDLWNIIINSDYWDTDSALRAYYSDEIIQWWNSEQSEEYSLTKVDLDGTKLMVSWKYEDSKKSNIRFYYVNTTSEEELIKTVSIVLYVIMALCMAGACLVGFFVGKKIETAETKQKEFFENASHELKTPLMAIQGYAEGLQAGITDKDEAAGVILSETDKMTGLVNDILSISRLESGAYKMNKEAINMQDFLSECLTSLEGSINEKNIKVSLSARDDSLEADRTQFEKAVRNILINAIRYAQTEIRIIYDGKQLIIWDDGTPISAESLEHLFERFYTGSNGNTGIGMSLTKEIVEQHGWKIRAENTVSGAQFVITF